MMLRNLARSRSLLSTNKLSPFRASSSLCAMRPNQLLTMNNNKSNTNKFTLQTASFSSSAGSTKKSHRDLMTLLADKMNEAQNSNTLQLIEIMEHSGKILGVLTPLSLLLSPSFICWPVDFVLGVVVPVHTYVGMRAVLEDYVPQSFRELAIKIQLVLCFFMGLGLLKINLCGPGIGETIKSLWRKVPKTIENKKN